ncbi:hypothetical protein I551_8423 [Mycobacterium ulcerans str. Harvey]|uniref:Uncharacterized protein n=1 Tax=Mycobacterium ulcerans str. Harvey TaxID=1299332 RepID=A0ABN0QKI5_MYCUL|nr:hypothetical protein I551_8423 [Mycobacterium ulcerans str. Harvey]
MRVESGGEHDDVHLAQHPVVGHDARVFNAVDARGDQLDIVTLDGTVKPEDITSRLHIGW